MAVVQISRIQLRRGRKNEGTGLPQLASGELAWAIDTQELYIGNGAVSEGSPAVGNTKVLTEHDNILDLLEQYQYKPNDTTILTGLNGNIIERTLQERLDEGAVNAASFGISGLDEDADQTALIQNAIWSLYANTNPATNKVALEFDPGTYKITGTLYIPSNVRLVGSGIGKTVFDFIKGGINTETTLTRAGTSVTTAGTYTDRATTAVTGSGSGAIITVTKTGTGTSYATAPMNFSIVNSGSGYAAGDQIKILGSALGGSSPTNDLTITLSATSATYPVFNTDTAFTFINETSTPAEKGTDGSTTANNQPKNILFKEFTVVTNLNSVRAFDFKNVKDSEFINVKALGPWTPDALPDAAPWSPGTPIENSVALEMTAKSSLVTCERNKFVGFQAEGFTYAVYSNTDIINNKFDGCIFKTLYKGIGFGEGSTDYGPRKNIISNSLFDKVCQEGILVETGYGNRSIGNTFVNVGNNFGGNGNNVYSQISFLSSGNSSSQDSFDRVDQGNIVNDLASHNLTEAYLPEIGGHVLFQETKTNTIILAPTTSPLALVRFPLNTSSGFEIDYVFQSTEYTQMRKGKLHIAVDNNNNNVQLVDEYEYIGADGEDGNVVLQASLVTSSSVKSVVIYYTNANTGDNTSTFTYAYTALS
jgi:hypothetical protein